MTVESGANEIVESNTLIFVYLYNTIRNTFRMSFVLEKLKYIPWLKFSHLFQSICVNIIKPIAFLKSAFLCGGDGTKVQSKACTFITLARLHKAYRLWFKGKIFFQSISVNLLYLTNFLCRCVDVNIQYVNVNRYLC